MVLYIDTSFEEDSTARTLADSYVSGIELEVVKINLYEMNIPVLNENVVLERNNAARVVDRNHPIVSMAIDFADAEKIIIAADYKNFSYPAILFSYLEAIMIDGITFDYSEGGIPRGRCDAKELVLVTAAGGNIYNPDHQLEHIKSIASKVFGIHDVVHYYVEGVNLPGVDAKAIIDSKMQELKVFAMMNLSAKSSAMQDIMVVDDSKVNILKTQHILKEAGYNTVSAMSGPECLKLLKYKRVAMILLDIEMPGMNGFETLEAIRNTPEYRDIPVVFVTSDNTVEVVIEASKHKISGYVTKPFTKDELMVHINRALHGRNN